MMNIDREEMLSYLKVLSGLSDSGFKCSQEITDVIKVIHEGYGFLDSEAKEKASKEYKLKKIKTKLNYELDYSGYHKKHGRLIRVTEEDRGIGKSTLLIEWAIRLNIAIVTNKGSMVKHLKDKAIAIYGHTKGSRLEVLLADPEKLRGKDLPNGVLVECVVTLKEYLELQKVVLIRGGFHHDKEFI